MPVGQMPVGQMPVGQMPVGQMPVGQMPVGQMPVGQMPVGQMFLDQKTFTPQEWIDWIIFKDAERIIFLTEELFVQKNKFLQKKYFF